MLGMGTNIEYGSRAARARQKPESALTPTAPECYPRDAARGARARRSIEEKSPMAEQKESSVLFSLKELMNLEENRIKEEEAEKDRRARHEAETRASAERAARDAEERRLREEEERRRSEEQRQREEAARLEAIRHGEIEKARAEATA